MTAKTDGVMLVNLGSPESTDPKDVKKYLGEFLMDERVIDLPYLLRFLIVKGIILQTRPKKSAHAYSKIWWPEGSPLVVISQRLLKLVQKKVNVPVSLGMRYGELSIERGLEDLMKVDSSIKKVKVVPLYPHYAMSSYETVVEKVKEVSKKKFPGIEVSFQQPFFDEENYIQSLEKSIEPYLQEEYDHLLFSYHGIPERHVKKTDPSKKHCLNCDDCCAVKNKAHEVCYRHQVYKTTELVTKKLNIPESKFSVSFQSRLGGDPWLKPYTDFRLEELPKEGVKKLLVICPAFVSDCLETLEEIGMEGKSDFLEAGGEKFTLIPCLNENENWVETLAGYCSN